MVSKKRTIDSDLLRTFVTIAHHGGVSDAAAMAGTTKSGVSKQLAMLEDLLQLRLFERNGRRMQITQEGKTLVGRAESVLADLDKIIEDLQEQKAQARGTVRLAASPEFGAFLSEHFIPPLMAQHSELKIAMSLDYAYDDLHDPDVDLAFRLGAVRDDRLVARHLGDLARVLVCSGAYQGAHAIDEAEDLAGANVVMFPGGGWESEWTLQSKADPARTCRATIGGRFAVQGVNAAASAAIGHLGVARIPLFVAAQALADGRLIRVLPQWDTASLPVHLAYRAGISRIGRVRAVIEAATAIVPSLLKKLQTAK